MVQSSVPTFTLDQMVVPRDLVLLPSNLLMMLVMQFSNSTVMIGKDALLKFVRIVSLATPVLASVAAALVDVEVLVVADLVLVVAAVVDLVDVGDLEADLEEAEVDLEEVMEAEQLLGLTEELLRQHHLIHSLTMLRLAPIEARQFMSVTFPGPRAMRILLSFSQPSERSSKPRFSMSPMDDPEELAWFDSTPLRMLILPSKNSPVTSMVDVLLD